MADERSMRLKALDMIALRNVAADYVISVKKYENGESGSEFELRRALGCLLAEAAGFSGKWGYGGRSSG